METIKNRWAFDNNNWNEDFYSFLTIQEIEEDNETFFNVVDEDDDILDTFYDYPSAEKFIKDKWEDEKLAHDKEEYEQATNVPDSIWSLGLQGMF